MVARNPNYSLEIVPGRSDDAYEENDSFATASDLGTLTSRFLAANLVMGDAADWYKFTTAGPAAAGDFVQIAFRHDQGDLELQLYDGSGTCCGSRGASATSRWCLCRGPKPGIYYVKVSGVSSALNRNYSLEIQPPPADDRYADDRYEDNDTRETAADLGTLGLSTPRVSSPGSRPWKSTSSSPTRPTGSASHCPPHRRREGTAGCLFAQTARAPSNWICTPRRHARVGVTSTQRNDRALLNYGWLAGTYYLKISESPASPFTTIA